MADVDDIVDVLIVDELPDEDFSSADEPSESAPPEVPETNPFPEPAVALFL